MNGLDNPEAKWQAYCKILVSIWCFSRANTVPNIMHILLLLGSFSIQIAYEMVRFVDNPCRNPVLSAEWDSKRETIR